MRLLILIILYDLTFTGINIESCLFQSLSLLKSEHLENQIDEYRI